MNDHTPRRPGPWGSVPPATAPETRAPASPGPAPVEGQKPVWAVVSTVLLAVFIWWLSGSWIIAGAVIWGLFVHEYGHVLAMNRLGMGPARIYIIPFLGGLARGQRPPVSEWDGVKVSLAGPLFGLLAAIPFFALFYATGQGMWLQGVFAIAFINLINLAPAPPLDGSKALGPVLARVHPVLERLALLTVGALAVWWGLSNGSYIFAAFLAIALLGHMRRGAWRPVGRRLDWREAGLSALMFAGVAAACSAVMVAGLIPLTGGVAEAASAAGAFVGLER